jgi:hypothetical protein
MALSDSSSSHCKGAASSPEVVTSPTVVATKNSRSM